MDPKPAHVPQAIRRREKKRQKTLNERKVEAPPPSPDKVLVSSEVGRISDFRTWSSCPIPLSVVVNREHYADGYDEIWMLADTKKVADGGEPRVMITASGQALKNAVASSDFFSAKGPLMTLLPSPEVQSPRRAPPTV